MPLARYPIALLIYLSLATRVWCRHGSGIGAKVPEDEWDAAMAHPNATGTFPIAGQPDVSKPWPGQKQGPAQNWTASILVRSDIPYKKTLLTGTSITIQVPDSLLVEGGGDGNSTGNATTVRSDDKWRGCTYVMSSRKAGGGFRDGESIDSTCQSVMPSGCADDLTDLASQQTVSLLGVGRVKVCPPLRLPDSCDNFDVDGSVFGFLHGADLFNGSETFFNTSRGEERGKHAQYDVALDTVWVFLSGWAYNDTATRDDQLKNGGPASLTCLRPDRLTQGSLTPSMAALPGVAVMGWLTMAISLVWIL